MRLAAPDLTRFAARVLIAAGLAKRHADACAATFVAADLLGFDTHGVAILPLFTAGLESGEIARDGEPELIARHTAHALLDGALLPGPVVMRRAVDLALDLSMTQAIASVAVRRSANTACLATYLPPLAAAGRIAMLFVATPGSAAVAPPGAARGAYSTDPIAACIPTSGDPVLFDFATSATTNRMTERARRAGSTLAFEALLDAHGQPSADPACLNTDPPGAIQPLGATHGGHKGFALALLNESLGGALAGFGRARAKETGTRAGSACFLQVIDPNAFAGRDVFLREMDALLHAIGSAAPIPGGPGPRIPGQRAFAARRERQRDGIPLHPDIPPLIADLSERYAVALPVPLPERDDKMDGFARGT